MAVVEVKCKNLKRNPMCPHGPTLKFVKINNGCKQEFYACSTFRDRKDCGFYLPVGDKLTDKIKRVWDLEREKILPSLDHETSEERLKEVKEALSNDRLYCHTCSELDVSSRKNDHKSHQIQSGLSDQILSHPSQILKPKEINKREAQYLFSSNSTKVIVENLQRAGVSKVLCLGTPRVHEHIQSTDGLHMESLLLDFDHRYHSFWSREKFIWFNMFNLHFYSAKREEPESVLKAFLSTGEQAALILDPPFGGHVDPLAATVRRFSKLYSKLNPLKKLKVIWIFPYFRERHITERSPDLKMLHYKVEYENHKEYSSKRKLGSPARLFTNMDRSKFVLPKTEGYRFCRFCSKWVSKENNHCKKCKDCTSKDGRAYTHCDQCEKCVKPKWQHCTTCQKCLPPEHVCLSQVELSPSETLEPRRKRIKKIQLKVRDKNKKKIKKY